LATERRFTQEASHELRTPLTVLRARMERLALARSDEERDEHVAAIARELHALETLVEALLLLARSEDAPLPRVPVNLCDLARDAAHRQELIDGPGGRPIEVDAPDEILVTVGAQQALFLLAALLTGPDATVGVENPGYPDARNIFAAHRARVVPLPLDRDGLALSPALDGCDYVYLTPSHQCPTNVTMPLARRFALLDWADARDRVLIEDDYETELGFSGRAQPALKSLDRGGRVLYVGSLSKTLAPGIRMGYIVGSRDLIREARALRRLMLRHPPANNARTVALFLAMGHHDALLRRLNAAYVERSTLLAAALAAHLPVVAFRIVGGASSCWLEFPDGVDTRRLADAALRHGALIEPGDVFFTADPATGAVPTRFARLGFAAIPKERIDDGIRALAAACAASGVRASAPRAAL